MVLFHIGLRRDSCEGKGEGTWLWVVWKQTILREAEADAMDFEGGEKIGRRKRRGSWVTGNKKEGSLEIFSGN